MLQLLNFAFASPLCLGLTILWALSNLGIGAEYFVSPSGDNNNLGTLNEPWRTIQKAANTMVAGDTCTIRAGTYRETVIPTKSGTSGLPIIYRAHAGEAVIINGCEVYGGTWTQDSGDIYKASIPMTLGHENQIFINGSMVWEARWPNVGSVGANGLLEFAMATMDTGTTKTTILDSALPKIDWSRGKVWVSSHKRWFAWTGEITAHGAGQLSVVNNADTSDNMICKVDGKFYVFGVRAALDSANEWYYESNSGELFLWANGGGVPSGVEYKQRINGFDLSGRSHIHLQNLKFFATSIKSDSSSNSLHFDGLGMNYLYHSNTADKQYSSQSKTGLILDGLDHVLRNSEIAYSSGTGVYLGGSGHEVINNYIHDHDYIGAYASPLVLRGSDFLISHNTITRAGRQCVQFGDIYGSLFQYNRVSFAGYLTWDLGLVYGNSIGGGNAEVRYNWFHDNLSPEHGYGIYYDHGCKNIITHHNVVWNVTGKAVTHNQYANYLLYYHNTGSTNGDTALGSAWNAGQQHDLHGCRYVNNVFNAGVDFDGTGQTLLNNSLNEKGIQNFLYLTPGSAPVDAAIPIANINDQWQGSAPDNGAYEIGGENWVPGHDFNSPPASIPTGRSLPAHRNLLVNGSFEAGTLEPWTSMAGNVTLNNGNYRSQWTANGTTLVGGYSAEFGSGQTGVSQTITGLEPDTTYRLMGKFRVESGESARLGVKNHGYPEQTGSLITDTITGATPVRSGATAYEWTQTTLIFRTGPNSKSAEVYAWKESGGAGKVYFEDGGVQMQDNLLFAEDFESGLGLWSVTDDVTIQNPAQSPFDDADADTKGARLQDSISQSSSLESSINVEPDTTLFVQFDFRFSGTPKNPGFQLKSGSTVGINTHLKSGSGPIQYKDGTTWTSLSTSLLSEVWYRMTYTINPASSATDGFSLRIHRISPGGYLDIVHSNLGFQSQLTSFDGIRFHFNTPLTDAAGSYFIDNVLVSTSNADLTLLSDVDLDGIDDGWEMNHLGNLSTMTADTDTDQDGRSDAEEYMAGTDPDDPHSRFQTESMTRINAESLQLNWMGMRDRYYALLWSVDLASWNHYASFRGQDRQIQAEVVEVPIDEADGTPGNLNKLFFMVSAQPVNPLP